MSPEQKLARSRTRLLYLKELQKRPNLSPEGKRKGMGAQEVCDGAANTTLDFVPALLLDADLHTTFPKPYTLDLN